MPQEEKSAYPLRDDSQMAVIDSAFGEAMGKRHFHFIGQRIDGKRGDV